MMKKNFISIAILAVLALSSPVLATTMTTNMTVDDGFNLYISTDDAALGTLVGTHNLWYDTMTWTSNLTGGVINYIHIEAWNGREAAGVLGDFTLSDNNFKFANGTQNLVTNTGDWKGYTDTFGGAQGTLVTEGLNGVSPWGNRNSIATTASWIWLNPVAPNETRYFSAAISPNSPNTQVPEPLTIALLGLGLVGVAGMRRKFKK